ncbi:TPA: helix-turn-helix transcriptional regulator [Streptococcus agalactiae]|nr:helix-turn-helix transcriptional regulator [Streptococcus agalactiae]
MIKKELGQEIRKLRTARGFTQETFSKACGLDRTYIADVELGKRNISIENIDKIAKGLAITLPELFKFNSPIQKTIILNINGEQFILESDTELTMDKKNYIEAICETMYDESNEWYENIYDMSPYDIAELFEKKVKEEVGITVTFKAIDLEVSILED